MKKIITTLITVSTLLVFLAVNVSAEEDNIVNKPNDSDTATGTVELYASKASSYSVKLPVSVDVSETSTTFKVYAYGDIDAAKELKVDKTQADSYALVDEAEGKEDVDLTIEVDKTFKFDDLSDDYDEDVYLTFTITHDGILAGSYKFDLPITIELVAAQTA